jgi:hypothetical protein
MLSSFLGETPSPVVMRSAARILLAAIAATTLTSCMDMSAPFGAGGRSLVIAPRFSQSASLTSAALARVGLSYNSVRIVIVRPETRPDTLKDTTIAFGPESPETTLELSVAARPSEELVAVVDFQQDGVVVYHGTAVVTAVSPTTARAATPVEIEVSYTGIGSTTATVSVSPGGGLYSTSSSTQFTAKAFDGASVELAGTPIFWSVNDSTIATISSTGLLSPKGKRGNVTVTATAANGVSTAATVTLAPGASGLRVVQGAGQTGAPNSTFPVPVIVELVAADGLPAAGTSQTVTFSASQGASITPATTTLDANSRASAMMTVGGRSGTTYIYSAQVGLFQVQWPGTATPGAPTHFVTSGSTTLTLTAGVIPNPIPTVRLADALENSVTGVMLKITVKEGGVALGPPLMVSVDSVGRLEIYRVAPTKSGTYTVLVETADQLGVPSVTYDVTVNAGPAAKLAFAQQPPATVFSGQPITIKVAVTDQFGNLVTSSAQTISISAEPGATGWTASGSASAVSGVATISATIATSSGARSGVKIQATGGTLTAALSAAFNITP